MKKHFHVVYYSSSCAGSIAVGVKDFKWDSENFKLLSEHISESVLNGKECVIVNVIELKDEEKKR